MGLRLYKYGMSAPYAEMQTRPVLDDVFTAECDAVVQEVQGLADKGWLRYLHLSDLHAPATMLDEPRRQCMIAVAEMARRLALDFVLLTGDILAGAWGNAREQQKTLLEIRELFAECGVPVIVCRGNHDDNSVLDSSTGKPKPENVISNAWWNWYMGDIFCLTSNQQVAPAGANGWFYVDIPAKKVRVVNINCSDLTEQERLERGGQNYMVVSQTQLDWLSSEALAVPEGWKCICASHFVPVAGLAIGGRITNATELYAVLETYADKIIAYNAGHNHVSANYVDGNGLRFITANASGGRVVTMSECQAGYGISGVSAEARATAPTGAMVFDICIVAQDGTVSRVRWGAKDDLFKDA